jgi:putative addiction module component (TIGR02574 family)
MACPCRSNRWSQGYTDPMTQKAAELLQKALSLSEEDRAELAGSLIESLDATVDEAAEAAWNQEIARRVEDLDSGKAKTFPWEAVRSRISTKFFASRKARADFKAFDKIMGRRGGKRPRAGDELPPR